MAELTWEMLNLGLSYICVALPLAGGRKWRVQIPYCMAEIGLVQPGFPTSHLG